MTDEELVTRIADRLGGRHLACAESCTGGRLSATIAAAGGASEWFRGALVAYQVEVKRSLLGVTAPSVISRRAAEEMAEGVARLLSADVALSTTGVVSGKPQDGHPAGTVMIGTFVDGRTRSAECHFEGDASAVCAQATRRSLEDLLEELAFHAG